MRKNKDAVWVIIPAYNEASRIGKVLEGVKSITSNIIVVDDGSKDDTCNVAKVHKVKCVKHIINLGKGAALKTGCDYAYNQHANVMVVIDADGQHKPKDIKKLLNAIEKVDVVFTYRTFDKNMPWVFRFGNWFINKSINWLYHIDLKDTQCGFRCFSGKVYPMLRWRASDYAMESEMIANAGKHNLSYVQVPIETIYEDRCKGTTIFDGIKIVINLFFWKFRKMS